MIFFLFQVVIAWEGGREEGRKVGAAPARGRGEGGGAPYFSPHEIGKKSYLCYAAARTITFTHHTDQSVLYSHIISTIAIVEMYRPYATPSSSISY